ncbi:PadR family transcriptional regulator [candidate division KSB1 bacterium]
MNELSKAEEKFLLSIWRLKDNAYGVAIRDKIVELTGKKYTYGTLYGILDQLVYRGYVKKIEGDPTPERGGRRKLFYSISNDGLAALKQTYEINRSLWHGVDIESLDKGLEA